MERYYRPKDGARLRNPADNQLVPPHGLLVISHFVWWARRVREDTAERIPKSEFLRARLKAVEAQKAEADGQKQAKADAVKDLTEQVAKAEEAEKADEQPKADENASPADEPSPPADTSDSTDKPAAAPSGRKSNKKGK